MSNVDKLSYFRFQTKVWFVFVLLFGVGWLMLWLKKSDQSVQALTPREKQAIITSLLPSKIDKMTELSHEVAPIRFETITRDLRSYPPEFKDRSHFEKLKGQWSVTVMDVTEHKVIADYLDTLSTLKTSQNPPANLVEQEKLAYFRYLDTSRKPHYMLTYGNFSSMPEAMGYAKLKDFRLPAGDFVKPEEINRYLNLIDNYERNTTNFDGDKNRPREIKLVPTQYEIPVAPVQPAASPKPKKPKPKDDNKADNGEKPKKKQTEKPKTELEKFEEAKRKAEAEAEAKKKNKPATDNDQ